MFHDVIYDKLCEFSTLATDGPTDACNTDSAPHNDYDSYCIDANYVIVIICITDGIRSDRLIEKYLNLNFSFEFY